MAVVPLMYLLTESARDMIAYRGCSTAAIPVTADMLKTLHVGRHVLISEASITVKSAATSEGIHADRYNVALYPLRATGTHRFVYATLAQSTADVVTTIGLHARLADTVSRESISLPPLDAVIVSKDADSIRLVESSAAPGYLRIILSRSLAVAVVMAGVTMITLLIRRSAVSTKDHESLKEFSESLELTG